MNKTLHRIVQRFIKNFKGILPTTPPLKGYVYGWVDEFGIFHPKRNYSKMTKHCGGWNNNNGR